MAADKPNDIMQQHQRMPGAPPPALSSLASAVANARPTPKSQESEDADAAAASQEARASSVMLPPLMMHNQVQPPVPQQGHRPPPTHPGLQHMPHGIAGVPGRSTPGALQTA